MAEQRGDLCGPGGPARPGRWTRAALRRSGATAPAGPRALSVSRQGWDSALFDELPKSLARALGCSFEVRVLARGRVVRQVFAGTAAAGEAQRAPKRAKRSSPSLSWSIVLRFNEEVGLAHHVAAVAHAPPYIAYGLHFLSHLVSPLHELPKTYLTWAGAHPPPCRPSAGRWLSLHIHPTSPQARCPINLRRMT